jgi:uncharacterized membrane protein
MFKILSYATLIAACAVAVGIALAGDLTQGAFIAALAMIAAGIILR